MDVSERLKSRLVGSWLGHVLAGMRDSMGLHRAARVSLETLGTIANDQLAHHLLVRMCPEGGTYLDVGAHVGSVIDVVKRHSRPGRIIAVEAIPDKARVLRKKFPDVEMHSCAAGDRDGEVAFFIDRRASSLSSLESVEGDDPNIERITVDLRRLDSLVNDDRIDLIKIDVEGAELGALKGAVGIVARSRPLVLFESGTRLDAEVEAIWDWFTGNDYIVVLPNRLAHEDGGMSRKGFVDAHLYPRRATNYFAVPRERRDEVRRRARQALALD